MNARAARRSIAVLVFVIAMLVATTALATPVQSLETTSWPWRLQDDDLRMRFSGAWRTHWSPVWLGYTARASSAAGALAWTSFDGTACAIVAEKGPARGIIGVYVDDVSVGDVDLYAPSDVRRESVWTTDTLAPGTHTLRLVVRGSKSTSSTGTGVVLDGFDLSGPPTAAVMPRKLVNSGSRYLRVTGRWYTSSRRSAIGGSALRTSRPGATVTMRFKGTAVLWLGRKDGGSGKAEVLLDGKRAAIVGQYGGASERRVIWGVTGLPNGVHTVTVRSLGSAAPESSGAWVDVDAFAHNGTVLPPYTPTPFKYPWRTYIVIDKSSFKLYWVRNGYLVKTYPIAHGKPSTPTPERVWRIDAKYRTNPSSVYGPRKMRLFKRVSTSSGYRYIYTNYAIHGTNQEWVIGTRASHGCIRMYNRHVLELWPQVPLGTHVVTRY